VIQPTCTVRWWRIWWSKKGGYYNTFILLLIIAFIVAHIPISETLTTVKKIKRLFGCKNEMGDDISVDMASGV
jgi:hypothetical protein